MVGVSYLDEIAMAIRREVPADGVPREDAVSLFRLYALLLLAKGTGVDAEDVHNAWTAWMLGHDPQHPALRPFKALDRELQAADRPYVEAIHRAALAGAARAATG